MAAKKVFSGGDFLKGTIEKESGRRYRGGAHVGVLRMLLLG